MAVDLVDVFQLQLAQQAALYNLTHMSGRKTSAERVASFFLRAQQLLPVTTTLEIGAHEATFSRKVKQQHPERTVRAFEANPHVYAHFLLEGSLRKAGIVYEHYAVGEADGSTPFYIYDKLDGKEEAYDSRRQSILPRAETEGTHHTTVWVPMARLDALCVNDSSDSRYALWIDAEGSSAQVLAGAEKTLQKTLIIIIELESQPKFAGQAGDREIMATLLARDFVPILRDFQFRHQYNAIFVRKGSLPLVEDEWQRYMQAALRHELQASFKLEATPQQYAPIAPSPLSRLRFDSLRELQEAMAELPLLRAPRTDIDPRRTVVACHISDLDEAVAFYRQQLKSLPAFYVLGDDPQNAGNRYGDLEVHKFADLTPGMDVQLYFAHTTYSRRPHFIYLAMSLNRLGIKAFGIECHSLKPLLRHPAAEIDEHSWDVIRNFVNLLDDTESQYTYMAVCQGRLKKEPGYVPLAGYPQYFHPQVHVEPGDILCEGGIDNGRTTLSFHEAMRGKGHIFAFEPLPENCAQLQSLFVSYSNIKLESKALENQTGRTALCRTKTTASTWTSTLAKGESVIPCTSIDDYFAHLKPPTAIKLDVEGAEPRVLQGAHKTILSYLPKLLISLYHSHQGPDFITIPQILLHKGYNYKYYCGQHRPWYYETILYAVRNQ